MTEHVDTSPAVTYQAPAPGIGYAEHAVTDTASASADVYVAPAPAASYATPAPMIVYAEPAVIVTAQAPVIEYAAETAVTHTAPALVNENVAPAPAGTFAVQAPVMEYAASEAAVTGSAITSVDECVAHHLLSPVEAELQ